MDRQRGMLAWLVLLAAVGAGWWWGGRPPEPPPLPDVATPQTAAETVTVHVAGWVARPGLVHLSAPARVADAVAAAGGVLPGAQTEAINLAESVTDGMQVIVPGPETTSGLADATGDPGGDGRLHLNRATVADLDGLPGIGPVIAERIVAHRTEHGPFQSVEDLLDVPGIGEAKLASLRDLVVP